MCYKNGAVSYKTPAVLRVLLRRGFHFIENVIYCPLLPNVSASVILPPLHSFLYELNKALHTLDSVLFPYFLYNLPSYPTLGVLRAHNVADMRLKIASFESQNYIFRHIDERRNTCLTVWSRLPVGLGAESRVHVAGSGFAKSFATRSRPSLAPHTVPRKPVAVRKFFIMGGCWRRMENRKRTSSEKMVHVCMQKTITLNARFKLIKCTGSNRSRNYCMETADVNCKW